MNDDEAAILAQASALPADMAAAFVENTIGTLPLPLGLAVHFVVDGEEVVIPMAVEESSVVAAASHGAKLAAAGGGFTTSMPEATTIGQVELRDVSPETVRAALDDYGSDWTARLNALIPSMVRRGGGVQRMEARSIGDQHVVVHVHVDTCDAMGANVVNTLMEALAPWLAEATGATVGLRILSNLATGRLVTARCRIPADVLGGAEVVAGIVAANAFALADPWRAATHNKGILNGVDPVILATGNDWRAMEAGAHAYAAHGGTYRALTDYAVADDGALEASITLPVQVGTVGGVTRLHPVAKVCLKILGEPDARRLAAIVASVGLAQNVAALRALSQEGIQQGHMALHARNIALQAGVPPERVDAVARKMVEDGTVSLDAARKLA